MVVVIFVDKLISWHDNVLLFPLNLILCFINLHKTTFNCCMNELKHSLVFCSRSGGLVFCLLCYFLHSLCPACPQGTFKSFQGPGLCHQCPLNSRSTIEAATLCGCRNGYYRGDMDKPEDVCTSESRSFRHADTQSTHFSVIIVFLRVTLPHLQICGAKPDILQHISSWLHWKSNISSLN